MTTPTRSVYLSSILSVVTHILLQITSGFRVQDVQEESIQHHPGGLPVGRVKGRNKTALRVAALKRRSSKKSADMFLEGIVYQNVPS